jgi:hypothetical protein
MNKSSKKSAPKATESSPSVEHTGGAPAAPAPVVAAAAAPVAAAPAVVAKGKGKKAAEPVAAAAPVVAAPAVAAPAAAAPVASPASLEGGAKKAKGAKKAAPAAKATKAAGAAKKAAAPKAAKKTAGAAKSPKAPKAAKAAKAPKVKAAKEAKTEDDASDELDGGKRSFKAMLPGSDKFEGRYTGLTPYQAANKALSKYYRESSETVKSADEITFSIRESTRGSKRSVYTYNGRREKLEKPVEYTIKGKDGDRTVVKEYKNRLTKVKKAEADAHTVDA